MARAGLSVVPVRARGAARPEERDGRRHVRPDAGRRGAGQLAGGPGRARRHGRARLADDPRQRRHARPPARATRRAVRSPERVHGAARAVRRLVRRAGRGRRGAARSRHHRRGPDPGGRARRRGAHRARGRRPPGVARRHRRRRQLVPRCRRPGCRGRWRRPRWRSWSRRSSRCPPETIEERFNLEPGHGATLEVYGSVTRGMAGYGFIYTNKESLSVGIGALIAHFARTRITPWDLLEGFKTHPLVAPPAARRRGPRVPRPRDPGGRASARCRACTATVCSSWATPR